MKGTHIKKLQKGLHHLLLTWLILTGLIIFSLTVAWQEGILAALYASDKSRISYAITLLYLLVTIHCAKRVYHISGQLNDSKLIESLFYDGKAINLRMENNNIVANGDKLLPECMLTSYIRDLIQKEKNNNGEEENKGSDNELINVYESRLKGPHEIGWFSADLMIKMGLLGTIIGFILMLGSVANITDFNVTTMQKVLKQMSTGMGTALYTTMTGLVCSMLASAQYHMLDRSVDELIETTKHLTQVYFPPRIK